MENNVDNWEDVSEYSKGETRTPKSFRFSTNMCDILVHRHRHYPGMWVVSCYTLSIDTKPLECKTLKTAKLKALMIVDEILNQYSLTREIVDKEMKKLNNDANYTTDETEDKK